MKTTDKSVTSYAIGDTAGTGSYRCCKCQAYVAVLMGPEDQLPPCENCGSDDDVRYEPIDEDAEQSHGVEAPK
jgi:hypothetical protein